MRRKRVLVSWSSGKDSAWALHLLRQDPSFDVAGLFTTVNQEFGRVSMHATPLDVLRLQAESMGLPLEMIYLPSPCTNAIYGEIMRAFVRRCTDAAIDCMAFGDIHLEDVRRYREQQLEGTGIEPVFPLWGMNARDLACTIAGAGVEAYVSCVDLRVLDASCAGKAWSMEFVNSLPERCDPCGENGEYHTVVVSGPMFSWPIPARVWEIVIRDGFAFADVRRVDIGAVGTSKVGRARVL